jgi:hypothetical protein
MAKTTTTRKKARKKSYAIDLHAHVIQPELFEVAKCHVPYQGPPKGVRLSAAQKKKMLKTDSASNAVSWM